MSVYERVHGVVVDFSHLSSLEIHSKRDFTHFAFELKPIEFFAHKIISLRLHFTRVE